MTQLENIEAIEKRLWSSADNLRANSNFSSNEYFLLVIRAFRTPLPPLEEQEAIAHKLDTSLGRFREAASAVEASIDRLCELRAALITAAVTGQIDVSSWAKRGETDRRLDKISEEMAAPRTGQVEARA